MNFGFFTISTFDLIPLCKHISNHLCEEFKASSFEMKHSCVRGAMEYNPRIVVSSVGTLERIDFIRQSKWFRIRKYVKLFLGVISFQFRNRSSVIYTIDLPSLVMIVFIKYVFVFNRTKIIYHQFEILEPDKMTGFNKLMLKMFKMIKGSVDLCIMPEIHRLNYFNRITGYSEEKSFLFPNTTYPIPLNTSGRSGGNEVVRIAHVGIAGSDHYVKEFLKVLPTLKQDREFTVTFIGYLPKDVVALISQSNLPYVKVLGDLSHKELQRLYHEVDIGVILYRDLGLNYKYCAPNKLYEYWAHGIFVVAHTLDGLLPLFKEGRLGTLVDMDDESKFKQGLEEAITAAGMDTRRNISGQFSESMSIDNYLNGLTARIQEW